jgi:peptide-methionine (S)-S-oxide reductase
MLHRILLTYALGTLFACSNGNPVTESAPDQSEITETTKRQPTAKHVPDDKTETTKSPTLATATLGAGCFWCIEAVLEQLDGVQSVESGYMGGEVANPTYRQVCTGLTGHAEVVQVKFDPDKISYKSLLKWFFKLHDPTTLNRQGADAGTQYRSVIFYHSAEQKAAAERAKKLVDEGEVFADPVVTEITEVSTYYPAGQDHQDFYRLNKTNGYCRAVITPKLEKLGLEK